MVMRLDRAPGALRANEDTPDSNDTYTEVAIVESTLAASNERRERVNCGGAWVITRKLKSGRKRYRVLYRLGGRESKQIYGGSFTRKADALARKKWITGELAAMRAPEFILTAGEPEPPETVSEVANRWMEARRRDSADATQAQHRSGVARFAPYIGDKPVTSVTWQDVDMLVTTLSEKKLKPATIKKTILILGMVLDYAEVNPNPAKHKNVKLPTITEEEPQPPIAAQVEAVFGVISAKYQLPLLSYDDTGMRLTELEKLTWGDVDVYEGRFRVTRKTSKTNRARWVKVHPVLFEKVLDLCPLEDRAVDRQVFPQLNGAAFRTELARACTRAGVASFSPHDLRHRRVSLLHHQGVSWAEIGERVGQVDKAVTANTYSHVLMDYTELNYEQLLGQLAEAA